MANRDLRFLMKQLDKAIKKKDSTRAKLKKLEREAKENPSAKVQKKLEAAREAFKAAIFDLEDARLEMQEYNNVERYNG